MEPVATVPVDPASALVYVEGWQSWSHTATFTVMAAPSPVTSPESLTIDCQYGLTAPAGVFRGSGLLAVDPSGSGPVEVFGAADALRRVPLVEAVLRGSELVVSADAPVRQVTDDGPGGIPGALGRWAEDFAAAVAIRPLRSVPSVWCSWYQYYSGVTQADVLWNLALMDSLSLPVGVVQIDDGYESCAGDWLLSSGRFSDLAGLVGRIRQAGRQAGIWIAPMLAGRSSELLAAHPDWVVRDLASDEPVYAGAVCRDSCTALDLTHPGAAGYLRDVLATLRGWGVDYFKIDFCYAGAIEGRRHQPMTGVEAYRHGLRLIRDAIGPDALLTGCGAPLLPSVGLVDAMRIGPDMAADYEPICARPTMPSQRNAARNVVARAWQHGRFWVNDPDCLMLRPQVQRRSDWSEIVSRYGGVRASGDGLGQLDDWGLAATRRLLIPSPTDPVT